MAWTGERSEDGQNTPVKSATSRPLWIKLTGEDLRPPWLQPSHEEQGILIAQARSYDHNAPKTGEHQIIYDRPGVSEHRTSMCVVLGVQDGRQERSARRHYVLLIAPTDNGFVQNDGIWERVGAGSCKGGIWE
jgi:hypothetical protein